jgi:hypothetical protein
MVGVLLKFRLVAEFLKKKLLIQKFEFLFTASKKYYARKLADLGLKSEF